MAREDCDIRVVLAEDNGGVHVRRTGDVVWLRPEEGLDGDGEVAVTFDSLAFALGVLGYSADDFTAAQG